MVTYRKSMTTSSFDVKKSTFEHAEKRERDAYERILKMDGDENPYRLHEELAQTMLIHCTIERHNPVLDTVLAKVEEIDDRSKRVGVTDTATGRMNQGAQFVRHLKNMIVLARVIAQGARNRDESRGAHFKPELPKRDDANWLRTTLAFHREGAVGYVRDFDYSIAGRAIHVTDAVDISLVKPRARKYETAGAASADATGAQPA
jgi:succinate dehydrogenase / fumarate reductase flavoprotein subunit